MSGFQFSLQRVLELRRQQAELLQAQRATLQAKIYGFEQQKRDLAASINQERETLFGKQGVNGNTLQEWASFEAYTRRRSAELDKAQRTVEKQMEDKRKECIEADRSVKLLEKLEDKQRLTWQNDRQKELELLAAESHLFRFLSEKRSELRKEAEEQPS